MTALTQPAVKPVQTPGDDDLTHYFCCDRRSALCGFAKADFTWVPWTAEPAPGDCPACVAAHQLSPKFCGVCKP